MDQLILISIILSGILCVLRGLDLAFFTEAATGLPLMELSAAVGALCAPVSLFVPSYLLAVMSGWKLPVSLVALAAAAALSRRCGRAVGRL